MAVRYLIGDCIEQMKALPDKSVHCCVTSPPYYALRDYGVDGQIGLEGTPAEYVAKLVEVFAEVWRVLRDDGTLWLNLGDSYAAGPKNRTKAQATTNSTLAGSKQTQGGVLRQQNKIVGGMKPKDRLGIPHRVVFALQDAGWYFRDEIVWHKPAPMPQSAKDRCTPAHEMVFMLTKSRRYFYDQEAIKEDSVGIRPRWEKSIASLASSQIHRTGGAILGGANSTTIGTAGEKRVKRSVWRVASQGLKEAHFATFPPKLITPMILAGTSERGCCPKCLAPAVRETEKKRVPTRPGTESKVWGGPGSRMNISRDPGHPTELDGKKVGNRDPQRHVTEVVTIGWKPSCSCGKPPEMFIPCTVLDPFGGAGTTGVVCRDLGRACVMCESNPDYAAMGERRLLEPSKPTKTKRARLPAAEPNLFDSLET